MYISLKKRYLASVLLVLLCTFTMAQNSSYDFTENNILYRITDATNNIAEVVGLENENSSNVSVYSYVYHTGIYYTVNSIGYEAFLNQKQLSSVFIDEGIENISGYAFENCVKLINVTLPSSIKTIGYNPFYRCASLESVSISNNLHYVSENGILYNYDKTKLKCYPSAKKDTIFVIPESIKEMKYFRIDNPYLKEIYIHKDITDIDVKGFISCSNLQILSVDSANPNFESRDGVIYIKEKDWYDEIAYSNLYIFPSGKENLTITADIRRVYGETLRCAEHLKNVRIEDGTEPVEFKFYNYNDKPSNTYPVTKTLLFPKSPVENVYLGRNYRNETYYGLFSGLESVRNVTLGKNFTEIGRECFRDCKQLADVVIESNIIKWGERAFYNTKWQNDISYINGIKYFNNIPIEASADLLDVYLKEGVTTVSEGLFRNSSIVSIKFPNSMTVIPKDICTDCEELTHVYFGNKTEIINDAFQRCHKIDNIKLPNTVTKINDGAFFDTYLDSLIIPSSVKYIGVSAIHGVKVLILEDGKEELILPNNNADDGYFPGSFEDTEYIYIGRNLYSNGYGHAGDPFGGNSYLKELTIGSDVTQWKCRTSLGNGSYPRTVHVLSKTPSNPTFGYTSNWALTIPKGTSDIYSSANFWGGFSPIEEVDSVILKKDTEVMVFSSPYDLDFSTIDGLEVYMVAPYDSVSGILKAKKVTKVPAATGVIIKGTVGTFNIPCTYLTEKSESPLKGVYPTKTLCSMEDSCFVFTLAHDNEKIIFSKVGENGIFLENGQAYLLLPQNSFTEGISSLECHIEKNIVISDEGKPYTRVDDENFDVIEYHRNFNDTAWHELYVPFAMNYEDWKDQFDVACINDVLQYDDDNDGIIDRAKMQIDNLTEGSTIPNKPYMIRSKEPGSKIIRVYNTTLKAACADSLCFLPSNIAYKFKGTYSGMNGKDMLDGCLFRVMDDRLLRTEDDTVGIKPFRWYLSINNINDNNDVSFDKMNIIQKGVVRKFTLDIKCSEGGTVSVCDSVTINETYKGEYEEGVKIPLKFKASYAYKLDSLFVNNSYVSGLNTDSATYNLIMDDDISVRVDFKPVVFCDSLIIKDDSAYVGSYINLPVELQNTNKIKALQFDILLPQGISIAENKDGYNIRIVPERSSSHVVKTDRIKDGLHITCLSDSNEVFKGNSGNIMNIQLYVSPDISGGSYEVLIENIKMVDADNNILDGPRVKALLIVKECTLGDVNDDGGIDVSDISAAAMFILQKNTEGLLFTAADVNGDGCIDVSDISLIVNIILSKDVVCKDIQNNSFNDKNICNSGIEILPFSISEHERKNVEVFLNDGNDEFAGLQFDISLPEGISIPENENVYIERNDGESTHSICSALQNNGSLRVVLYSVMSDVINGTAGPIMALPIECTSETVDGNIKISNIVMAHKDGRTSVKPYDFEVPVNYGNTTGLDNLLDDGFLMDIYTVEGTLVKKQVRNAKGLSDGIYIIKKGNRTFKINI